MSVYQDITRELGDVKLIGISKTKPVESILGLYHQGLRRFGENKVQELCDKYEQLPKDIEWHMVGHVQRNKVKYMAPFVFMIHAVDSLELLLEIEKQAAKHNRVIQVLLQMHIAKEDTKFGMDTLELINVLEYYTGNPDMFSHVCISGLMGMATNTDDTAQIHNEFAALRNLFIMVKESYLPHRAEFCELSMGMSSDYQIAIAEGSTMVRIGSLLFGER